MHLIDRLEFDPVNAGPLDGGVALQPGGPVFGIGLSADKLTRFLPPEPLRARRYELSRSTTQSWKTLIDERRDTPVP
jgi:hypothetical protein